MSATTLEPQHIVTYLFNLVSSSSKALGTLQVDTLQWTVSPQWLNSWKHGSATVRLRPSPLAPKLICLEGVGGILFWLKFTILVHPGS